MANLASRAYHKVLRLVGVEPSPAPDPNPFPVNAWDDPSYEAWFEAHRATPEELARQREEASAVSSPVTFSFVVPLYQTPLPYLRDMAESVLAQTYPHFQLVLVVSTPDHPGLAQAVADLAARDGRVTVVTLEGNCGIVGNTNAGLAAATGDFCCFLDHDDFIEPDLLFEYAKALGEQPDIDVLYCDEDLVEFDEALGGFRHLHPLFKAAYEPELMLCKNAIVHLLAVRRKLIDAVPVPDARYDGAQDYNMTLRCAAMARCVHGVQRVLYHWRVGRTSTATDQGAKPYGQKAYRLCIQEELERCAGTWRIAFSGLTAIYHPWFVGKAVGRVSVVVDAAPWADEPTCAESSVYGTILRFVDCLAQTSSHPDVEVLLVGAGDAASGLREPFRAVACAPSSTRFARLNAGAAQATGEHLVFLDAGCAFETPEPLEQLAGLCALDGVGVSAPKTLYRDRLVKGYGVAVTREAVVPLHRGFDDGFPAYQCNAFAFQNASACGWQGLTVARDLFGRLGGFDEAYDSEMGAVDLCARVRSEGLRVAMTCTVKLRTSEAAPEHFFVSSKNAPDYPPSDVGRFDAAWPGLRAAGDPYLNVNLDQASGYYQLPPSAIPTSPAGVHGGRGHAEH